MIAHKSQNDSNASGDQGTEPKEDRPAIPADRVAAEQRGRLKGSSSGINGEGRSGVARSIEGAAAAVGAAEWAVAKELVQQRG